jgi:hypothetical protein
MKNYRLNTKTLQQTKFIPIEKDDLFWCLFIGHFGKSYYDDIVCHQRKNRELSEKNKIIEFINCQADIKEKNKKILISILSTEKTTVELLVPICKYYNISVLFVDELDKYYEAYTEASHIFIIQQYHQKHIIDFDSTIDKIKKIQHQ